MGLDLFLDDALSMSYKEVPLAVPHYYRHLSQGVHNNRSSPLYSNMTLRLSGHFSIFGLAFFVVKSHLRMRDNGVVKNL